MAKIKISPDEPDALQRSPKGFVIRETRWGNIAQKWPRKRPKASTPQQQYLRDQFGLAGRMAANPTYLDLETARYLSQDMENPPRDLLTAAMYGKLYQLENPDGTIWPVADHSYPPEPLPPTPPERKKMWEWGAWDEASTGTLSTSSNATKGMRIRNYLPYAFDAVRWRLNAVAVGSTWLSTVWLINSSNELVTKISEAYLSPPNSNNGVLQFANSGEIDVGEDAAFLLTRTDSTATFATPLRTTGSRWLFPFRDSIFCTLQSIDPQPTDALTIASSAGTGLGIRMVE